MEMEVCVPSEVTLYDKYRYEPLIAEDAVRVLVLEPADHFESPLRCSITQHRRDSQSRSVSGCEYSAVSYTWGASELSHQLLIRTDGKSWSRLQITANVDSLLRHFRVPHKARLLWVDAVCLNQKDEIEKTRQIPLMGRIYSDAKRVRIWLGDDEVDKAEHAFAVIRDIGREYQRKKIEEELQCLAEFFNRPWFTRRWVIQEAFFSHDAVFHYGIHKLSLSRVMAALGKVKDAGDHELVGYGASMLLTSIGSRNFEKKGLLSLLWDFHDSECSDPRDRIAAVYALVNDGKRPLLQYSSRNWKEIYMEVASYSINNPPEVAPIDDASSVQVVLQHLWHFGSVESQTDADYPSWVPDWSRRRKYPVSFASYAQSLDYNNAVSNYRTQLDLMYDWVERMKTRKSADLNQHQERIKVLDALKIKGPDCMKSEVTGQRLRLNYHPLIFFHQCGKVDLVIRCSTGPDFWHKVVKALRMPTTFPYKLHEIYAQSSLLGIFTQLLVNRDEAAGKAMGSYSEEILKELYAYRDDPEALGTSHSTHCQYISTILRHLCIIRIQASKRSYWAIGPPDLQVGDWIVSMLLPRQNGFVPTIFLRPIDPKEAEIREPQRVSRATGTKEGLLRYFGASIAAPDCLHVKARFVGPGSCFNRRPPFFNYSDQETVVDIIVCTTKAARDKGLPGPVVFDVV